MPDREKVIAGINKILSETDEYDGVLWNVLALLKERDGCENCAIAIEDRQPVVRCRDCKHGEKVPAFKYYPDVTWCNKYLTSHNDNWFCADGKRAETEVNDGN